MNCDKPKLRIAMLHQMSAPWGARLADGIHRYAKEQGGWQVFSIQPFSEKKISAPSIEILEGWQGDGILFASNQLHELRFAKKLGIPAINLASGLRQQHGIPRVSVDHYLAGCMAAEHFLERDIPHLAFFGPAALWYSRQRCEGFKNRVGMAGMKCRTFLWTQQYQKPQNWHQRIEAPSKWLKSLPLPCGIFAVEDFTAQLLLDVCKEIGLRVPQDIAVIGMDNNDRICEHSVPKLTSIARNAERVGYEAAALLHSMIRGESSAVREILVRPERVILRESSDMMYCSDPQVRQAIEYMRQNLGDSYNIDAIADHLGISKRTLERGFVRATNSPPYQYLIRMRIHHARTLMEKNPKKNVAAVAAECGFASVTTFYSAFLKATGVPPSTYRKSLKPNAIESALQK